MKPIDAIWTNVNLVCLNDDRDYGIIPEAAIVSCEGKIAWLGPQREMPKEFQSPYKIKDGKGCYLTPGLIDCHTHLVYAGNRTEEFELRQLGKSYAEIQTAGGGILSTVKATRAATESELVELASRRVKQMFSEGVTTIEIKSGYGLDLETELKILRVARQLEKLHPVTIRTTFLGAHALPPEFASRSDDYIKLVCDTMLPTVALERLADAVDIFTENIAFNLAQTERVFLKARELKLPIKCHGEQLSSFGATELAAKYHALSVDHLEYASESQVQAMREADVTAVLLPGAYYYLQETQKPPIEKFRENRVKMAIATDCNPGTSPTTSLLLMMNMACVLFNLTPLEALQGVTRHAAKALGMHETHGSLAIGKQADFALWNIEHPRELSAMMGTNSCVGIVKNGR